jgi:hypothetical protein
MGYFGTQAYASAVRVAGQRAVYAGHVGFWAMRDACGNAVCFCGVVSKAKTVSSLPLKYLDRLANRNVEQFHD